jgi:CubicO group peptidase (beta-lactamase class C family)
VIKSTALAGYRASRTDVSRRSRLVRLLLCSALVVSAAPATAKPEFAPVDAVARAAIERGELASVAYAISRNGHVLHSGAFGYADAEHHIAATLHTAYPLASLTKPITATALLVLHARSGLALDTSVSDVLNIYTAKDPAQNPWHDVTLARLLHHTAGLGTYARIYFADDIEKAPPFPASLRDYSTPVQTPGLAAEYSNLGYGLLGQVIAEQSGASFPDYVRRNVFVPLHMRDAFIAGMREQHGARGYDSTLKLLPQLWNDTPGAGNAYASVDDLQRFGQFHLAPQQVPAMRLSTHDVAAMRERDGDGARHSMYGADTWYGQGWYVRGDPDTPALIWHEGGMPGASALLALYPGRGLVVTVLTNCSDAQTFVETLATKLVAQVDADAPTLALEPLAQFKPLQAPSAFTGHWRGTIRIDGVAHPVNMDIDAAGNGRLSYAVDAQSLIEREFHAMTSSGSLVSAVQGPWHSKGAPDGASTLLVKLVLHGSDRLEGAVVAYKGPRRLEFLLPYSTTLQRIAGP